VTDANGCSKTSNIDVLEADSFYVEVDSVKNVSCFAGTDGYIKISPIGGTPSYSYLWTGPNNYINPNPTQVLNNREAGLYTITITDQNNCQANQSIIISEPIALSLSSFVSNISCYGLHDATISTTISGGIPPYLHSWNTAATTSFIDSLYAGNYTLTITDSNNCIYQSQYNIIEPDSLSISYQQTDVSCFLLADAYVNLTVIGGSPPFTYNWNNNVYTSEDLINITAGDYTIIVTDNNNCQQSDSIYISQPQELNLSLDSIVNVDCFNTSDGMLSISATGGTIPYVYSWADTTIPDSIRTQLSAATYLAFVMDANNCLDSSIVTISQPQEIAVISTINPHLCFADSSASISLDSIYGGIGAYTLLWGNLDSSLAINNLYQDSINLSVTDSVNCINNFIFNLSSPDSLSINFSLVVISCFGANDGLITSMVSGGVSPFQYLWSTGDTTAQITGLGQGVYILSILDANACTFTSQTGMSDPNPLISVFSTNISVSCYGESDGLLSVNSSGGTTPYTYLWSTGDSTNIIDSLSSGMYYLTTTDANNCITQSSTLISEPSPITFSSQVNSPSCIGSNDGQININLFGGTAPYSHHWSNGDTLNFIFGNANNYTDSIIDNKNCLLLVTQTIQDPQDIQITSILSNVSCFGFIDGNILLQISGGNPPFSYNWSNGDITISTDSLSAAYYFVEVTDANNCIKVDTFLISQPQSDIQISATIINTACFSSSDGAIDISVSGGSGPYTYLWNNSITTEDLLNINSGTYTIQITDNVSCQLSVPFLVQSPDSIALTVLVDSISCNGLTDGVASLSIVGGTAPFSINWFNNLTSSSIQNLQEMPTTIQIALSIIKIVCYW